MHFIVFNKIILEYINIMLCRCMCTDLMLFSLDMSFTRRSSSPLCGLMAGV